MGRLERRLERLEARTGADPSADPKMARHLERYFYALENALREKDGLDSLPNHPPLTKEDYEDDLIAISCLRESPGWQTAEAMAFLDEWEAETRKRLDGSNYD